MNEAFRGSQDAVDSGLDEREISVDYLVPKSSPDCLERESDINAGHCHLQQCGNNTDLTNIKEGKHMPQHFPQNRVLNNAQNSHSKSNIPEQRVARIHKPKIIYKVDDSHNTTDKARAGQHGTKYKLSEIDDCTKYDIERSLLRSNETDSVGAFLHNNQDRVRKESAV